MPSIKPSHNQRNLFSLLFHDNFGFLQFSGQGNGIAPLAPAEDEFACVTLRKVPVENTNVEQGQKPAVPERPATLQRPLSSSFRVSKLLSDPSSAASNVPNSPISDVNSSSCYGNLGQVQN